MLNVWMVAERRAALQRQHDANVVRYALGTPATLVVCPGCEVRRRAKVFRCSRSYEARNFQSPYAREFGCNFVQCALQSCAIWFCAACGAPTVSTAHFGSDDNDCRLGAMDRYCAAYPLRTVARANIFALVAMLPALVYATLVLAPLCVAVVGAFRVVRCVVCRVDDRLYRMIVVSECSIIVSLSTIIAAIAHRRSLFRSH